jgi:Tfp pilus assembly protein PilF
MAESGPRKRIETVASGCILIVVSCVVLIGPQQLAGEGGGQPPGLSLAESKARAALDVAALGRDLFQKKEYRRAAIEFEKVLQIDPSNSAAAEYLKLCEKWLERQ